jgi:hypothetical protein
MASSNVSRQHGYTLSSKVAPPQRGFRTASTNVDQSPFEPAHGVASSATIRRLRGQLRVFAGMVRFQTNVAQDLGDLAMQAVFSFEVACLQTAWFSVYPRRSAGKSLRLS